MAERDKDAPRQPTHRAYSVIRREGQDDFWLNIGLVFPHKDNGEFNIMLQAFPLDGKIVCREVTDDHLQPIRTAARASPSAANVRRAAAVQVGRERMMAATTTSLHLVEFYTIQLAQLADGTIHVALTATSVDETEPQLLSQEIASERVPSIDDALALIREGVISTTPNCR